MGRYVFPEATLKRIFLDHIQNSLILKTVTIMGNKQSIGVTILQSETGFFKIKLHRFYGFFADRNDSLIINPDLAPEICASGFVV